MAPRRDGFVKKVTRPLEKRVGRALFRFINGVDWFLRDPQEVVGNTPFEVVFRKEKLALRRYRLPEGELFEQDIPIGTSTFAIERPRQAVPVLMIPPLMVKPFIFDLRPERSFVLHLLKAGFDVFLVDFGEPDRADAHVTLEHYVVEWLPAVVQAMQAETGSQGVSMVGYCMGGLFGLMYAAYHHDPALCNLVTIASPIDAGKLGLLSWVARVAHSQIEGVARQLGNIPGELSSRMFKMMAPVRGVTRYADLFFNMWDEEYVNGFDAMNQWVGNFIDYPAEAFQQFFRDFVKDNGLKEGTMLLGGRPLDLKRVQVPLLAFAGDTDKVVPPVAARAILDLIGSQDVRFEVVPGGHMGVFAGSAAPTRVWEVAARWLGERSGAQ